MSSLEQLAGQLAEIYGRCEGCRYLLETPRHGLPFCGYQLATGRPIPEYNVEMCPHYINKKEVEKVKITPELREQIKALVYEGKTNQEISEALGISTKSAEMTRRAIKRKAKPPADIPKAPPKPKTSAPKFPVTFETMLAQIERAAHFVADMGAEVTGMTYNSDELSVTVIGARPEADIKIQLTIMPK